LKSPAQTDSNIGLWENNIPRGPFPSTRLRPAQLLSVRHLSSTFLTIDVLDCYRID
jgi:hypothetical protein